MNLRYSFFLILHCILATNSTIYPMKLTRASRKREALSLDSVRTVQATEELNSLIEEINKAEQELHEKRLILAKKVRWSQQLLNGIPPQATPVERPPIPTPILKPSIFAPAPILSNYFPVIQAPAKEWREIKRNEAILAFQKKRVYQPILSDSDLESTFFPTIKNLILPPIFSEEPEASGN